MVEKYRWRAVLGLIIVFCALVFEKNWLWGVLFLMWALPDIRRGTTHFLEMVEASKNPIVFWLIQITWIGLSIYLIWVDWGNFF